MYLEMYFLTSSSSTKYPLNFSILHPLFSNPSPLPSNSSAPAWSNATILFLLSSHLNTILLLIFAFTTLSITSFEGL